MTELAGADRVAPGAVEAWRRHLGKEVDADSLRAGLGRGSLPRAFHETAVRDPERIALTVDYQTITHGDLDRVAARVGGWLRAQGISPEERVVLCGRNSLTFVIAYLGVLRAGGVVVPAGAAVTQPELRHLAEDSGAACALTHSEALERLRSIAGDDASLRLIVALEEEKPEAPSLGRAISEGEPLQPGDVSGDSAALLAYTSGTTGRPKGVPISHANLLASIRAAMREWGWDENDVLVHALPFTHQHGLGGVHATLLAGSRAVVHEKFDPGRLCAAIESEKATVLFAVPAIYEKLAAWGGIENTDFSSLRLAVSGSAALSPALARKVSSVLGQDVLERYGSTESGLSVSNPYEGPRKFGSVGLALPGTELAVVDDEGRGLPPGDDSEIVLRGPQVFSGYWRLPEAIRDGFYPGGWFRTGDVGRVDPEDGYLTITRRSKEMIISGGLNVYPREVELALEEHAAVDQAAVVGVPSERWGEEVVAYVVPAEGREVDHEELTARARERSAPTSARKGTSRSSSFPATRWGRCCATNWSTWPVKSLGMQRRTREIRRRGWI